MIDNVTPMSDEDAIQVLETVIKMFNVKARKSGHTTLNVLAQAAILKAIAALKRPKVTYICKDRGNDYCHHTSHVSMAKHFKKVGNNMYEEIEEECDNG